MKVANVATAKSRLSRLLKQVQRGESVLITDRNQPVAQLAAALTLTESDRPDLRFACADEHLAAAAEIEGLKVI